ncbi:MAG: hypothetical protein M1831_003063 [Alyxoria varia]|nr:MAG: hypothetical protein M1831_003063 [Alyxoria varia]
MPACKPHAKAGVTSDSTFKTPNQLTLKGYVVVATDYASLGAGANADSNMVLQEYITGPAQAEDVLHSVSAARQAFLEFSRKLMIVRSSQGGAAAWLCAEKLLERPMDGYLGTVC